MSIDKKQGRILGGDEALIAQAYEQFNVQAIDLNLLDKPTQPPRTRQKTIAEPISISGPGTFSKSGKTTITFEPTDREGWWLDRIDRPECLPVRVGIDNVWTTGAVISNIVLRAGPPQNYVRMVEHIIALRMGMDIDNLMIRLDSGDPPLFEHGSLDLIDALDRAGSRYINKPVNYVTVKEPVTLGGSHGQFLTLSPHTGGAPKLTIDCAIDFPNAIGRQRICFPVSMETTQQGALARTNTTYWKMVYCKTIGKVFADIRHLGYTDENILIAKKRSYHNAPRLYHDGKALEAAWHRGVLDLQAALALISNGLFAGEVTSYKAGHRLDCDMITRLYLHDLLKKIDT